VFTQERIYFAADNYRIIRNSWAGECFVNIETAREFSQKIEYDTDTWGV